MERMLSVASKTSSLSSALSPDIDILEQIKLFQMEMIEELEDIEEMQRRISNLEELFAFLETNIDVVSKQRDEVRAELEAALRERDRLLKLKQ